MAIEQTNPMKAIEDTLTWISIVKPLLYEFVYYVKLIETDPAKMPMPTIGVRMDHNYINIHYNKDFIAERTDKELRVIIMHELWHVILAHVFSRLPESQVDNIAADIEINQSPFLDNIPQSLMENSMHYQKFGLTPGGSREFYYETLMQNAQKLQIGQYSPSDGSGGGDSDQEGEGGKSGKNSKPNSMDDHSGWGHTQQDVKEIWRDRVKAGVESAISKNKGDIPQNLIDRITADWKKNRDLGKILKKVIGKQVSSSIQEASYWRKRNKRFKSYPGTRSYYGPKFVIAIDTSGSMSEKELEEVYAVIRWIKRCGYEAKLIQCDCEITDVTDIGKLKPKIEIKGRGGTSSLPVFTWVEKNGYKPNMLIFFTDLETDFPNPPPPYKVTWVSTRKDNMDMKVPFGNVIGNEID